MGSSVAGVEPTPEVAPGAEGHSVAVGIGAVAIEPNHSRFALNHLAFARKPKSTRNSGGPRSG